MSDTVKKLTEEEMTEIYHTYMKEDFPSDELKPLSHITRSMEAGFGFSLGIYDGKKLAGYAVLYSAGRQSARFSTILRFCMTGGERGWGIGLSHC